MQGGALITHFLITLFSFIGKELISEHDSPIRSLCDCTGSSLQIRSYCKHFSSERQALSFCSRVCLCCPSTHAAGTLFTLVWYFKRPLDDLLTGFSDTFCWLGFLHLKICSKKQGRGLCKRHKGWSALQATHNKTCGFMIAIRVGRQHQCYIQFRLQTGNKD